MDMVVPPSRETTDIILNSFEIHNGFSSWRRRGSSLQNFGNENASNFDPELNETKVDCCYDFESEEIKDKPAEVS